MIALIGTLTFLGGCNQASEDAFNSQYDKKFAASCVSSATQRGAPQSAAVQLCDCALKRMDKTFSAMEKASMPDEKVNPIIEQCVKEIRQT
ncbi:MAG TPA: hypothetical protein VIC34_04590 [Croceibacterium sp.]